MLQSECRLPDCLTTRRLVFGDEEQIKAINELQGKHEVAEEERVAIEAGELHVFKISVSIQKDEDFVIVAESEKEAVEQAKEEFMESLTDWDVGVDVDPQKRKG